MDNSEDQQKSAEYMRLAIPLMNKYGIAMSPENYAVWYEYVSGNNLLLTEAVDLQLAEDGTFTEENCLEIFQRFLGSEKEQENLMELRKELRRLLEEILGHANSGVEAASEVSEQLADTLSKLHPDMTREQIHEVVQDVINETRQFMSSGNLLTERLNSAVVDIEVLKNDFEVTRKQAKIDHLTNLDNRRSFDELMANVLLEADETGHEVCVIFCDMDLFKQLNAKHGHLVGDQVLKVVAATLKAAVKGRDFVSRYGGEEFTITLLNTSLEDASKIAESIRNEIANKRIQRKDTKEALGKITMSFGVARYFPSEGLESFLQRADRALYQSKRKGRDTVTEAQPPII